WASSNDRQLWAFRVRDKFGDSGLTGVASVERDGSRARLADFVLSCRVMGRKVEETMFHVAARWARAAGLDELYAEYKRTPKNKPCLDFFKKSGLERRGELFFAWTLQQEYPASPEIQLVEGSSINSVAGLSAATEKVDPSR